MGIKTDVRIMEDNISSVRAEVYVIGTYASGECSALLLYINNSVRYTIVIDSCERDLDKLRKYVFEPKGITSVDFICWTHPHEDHTKGITKLIKEYSSKDTILLTPIELYRAKEKLTRASIRAFSSIENIGFDGEEYEHLEDGILSETKEYVEIENLRKTGYKGINIDTSECKLIYNSYYKDGISKKATMSIEAYAPIKDVLTRNSSIDKLNNNDFSIVLSVDINGSKFIFGSDIENISISKIKERCDIFQNVMFAKIPHHGGKSGKGFIDLIEDDNNPKCYVTTVYSNTNKTNPCKDILDLYKKRNGNVYCTNEKHFKTEKQAEDFGIVVTQCDLIPGVFEGKGIKQVMVEKKGDAYQYF